MSLCLCFCVLEWNGLEWNGMNWNGDAIDDEQYN